MSSSGSQIDDCEALQQCDHDHQPVTELSVPQSNMQQAIISSKKLVKPDCKKTSTWWKFFLCYPDEKCLVHCKICNADINIGKSLSTSKLQQHIEIRHKQTVLDLQIQQKEATASTGSSAVDTASLQTNNRGIKRYFPTAPRNFDQLYVDWMIESYIPFDTCEDAGFRRICNFLNPKVPPTNVKRIKSLLIEKESDAIVAMRDILSKEYFSLTDDSWTSNRNQCYTGVTVHWIDGNWKLRSCALGCKHKEGKSTSEEHIREVEAILSKFNLSYKNLVANVTDTEATMVAAGRILVQNSKRNGGESAWSPCVDHLLECTTAIAFHDSPNSEATLASCRKLVGYFKSSAQATEALINFQNASNAYNQSPNFKAVTVIQDVSTRWWSTWSMCQRLLRLKNYFKMMIQSNSLSEDYMLSEEQWTIVSEVVTLLEPFMETQRYLEGDNYVTISSVPRSIISLRKLMKSIVDNEDLSKAVRDIAAKMLSDFNARWGHGDDGTVFSEHTSEGFRRRPKGIPLLTLLAAAVDPRFKALIFFSPDDRNDIYQELENRMVKLALQTMAFGCQNDEYDVIPAANEESSELQFSGIFGDDYEREVEEYNALLAAQIAAASASRTDEALQQEKLAKASQLAKDELKNFLAQPMQPMRTKDSVTGEMVTNDPLEWWAMNDKTFPLIGQLARRYLCIPATSAPSERLFSSAGMTISKRRASLNPDAADSLVFLHDAIGITQECMLANST
jgi:zinc finger BED domain-containing protein 1 (E3 SUMO-protein ligase ZBED1)